MAFLPRVQISKRLDMVNFKIHFFSANAISSICGIEKILVEMCTPASNLGRLRRQCKFRG